MVLADRAYGADWLRNLVFEEGGWANIPLKSDRKSTICFSHWIDKQRNLVERFINKIGSSFLAMAKLAGMRLRLRNHGSTT